MLDLFGQDDNRLVDALLNAYPEPVDIQKLAAKLAIEPTQCEERYKGLQLRGWVTREGPAFRLTPENMVVVGREFKPDYDIARGFKGQKDIIAQIGGSRFVLNWVSRVNKAEDSAIEKPKARNLSLHFIVALALRWQILTFENHPDWAARPSMLGRLMRNSENPKLNKRLALALEVKKQNPEAWADYSRLVNAWHELTGTRIPAQLT